MEIIKGKLPGAKKVVVYGPEGIGKSTFAARFPDPLFIDTEGSTKDMDVSRTSTPTSWSMLMEQIAYVRDHPQICKTLVVDTIDWAEQMCVNHICEKHQKQGIEDFGYGNGYVYAKEEFGRFLNKLSEVIDKGINIVLTAHAQMRKFEQPDEMGSYDRWELKLGKKTTSQTSPLVKEWADMVLFAKYKTYSVAVDDKGKKRKAQGGSRIMYTAHHPCWDAKNRYGLPEEMPFDYAGIAPIIEQNTGSTVQPPETLQQNAVSVSTPALELSQTAKERMAGTEQPEPVPVDIPQEEPPLQEEPSGKPLFTESNPDNIPQALKDLMAENNIVEWDIQNVVAARGYYPSDTPIERYDPGFIQGVLVAAWPKVHTMIKDMKDNMQVPFN